MGYWTQGMPQLPLKRLGVEHLQAMGPPSHQEPEQTLLMPAPGDPAQVGILQAQALAPTQLVLEAGNPVQAGIPQVQHQSLTPRPSHHPPSQASPSTEGPDQACWGKLHGNHGGRQVRGRFPLVPMNDPQAHTPSSR